MLQRDCHCHHVCCVVSELCVQDARQPQLHHWFVKRAVALAMDKHDKEREMTSVLLCSLHNTVCPSSFCTHSHMLGPAFVYQTPNLFFG